MPAHYSLRCLGPPLLLGPNGAPIRFKTRKHFALLIYLAVEPDQPHRRQRLADLLWPRASESDARHSVATAVSMFRNRLTPRAVTADRDHVRLTIEGLTLDLARLSRGEILGDEITPPLEIGSFLEDFELSDAPEFMLWRDRQQARFFPAIREGLLLLIDRCRRTGNFRQIEVLADRLLAIDHLSEDGVRAKMEARAFDGDRLSALKLFEEWQARLSEQLGAVPSAQLEGIALRLRRRGWERTTSAEIPTVPTDHWRGHRFVGRAREYRALYESWERTARGDSANALVLGDSGVGKTTLTDRLITAAGLEGAATVRVQCYELDREIPYAALAGLVRGLLERPGSSGTRPAALADLSVCMPEIRQRYPDLPQPAFADGEGVRVQLAEGAHELVSAVAEESPVILVVDDLHLADDASIAVLNLVLRRTTAQPIMLVLTARPSELERSPSARRVREGSEALRLRTIEIPPMTEDESRELLAALLEGAEAPPNAAERRALLGAAAGYPMVLELFVRDWLANGRRAMALTFGAMTPDVGHAQAAEHTYKALIDRIIHELPTEVRAVLNLAAILGNRLNDLDMYGLVDLTLARTMTGMTMLNDLRLLRDNGRELGFRNELIRAQAYMNVPSTLRRALHSRVAERLIAGQSDRPPTGLELAWHCFRAGKTDEARHYLLSGAREAIDDGAVCEAELALVSGMAELSEAKRIEARLLLAEALLDQGRWRDLLAALLGIATSPDSESFAIAGMLRTAAEWKLGNLTHSDACQSVKDVLLLAANSHSDNVRHVALMTSVMLLAETQDRPCSTEALSHLKRFSFDPRSRKEQALFAESIAIASHFAQSPDDYNAAETALAQALTKFEDSDHGRLVQSLLMTQGSFKASRGQYEDALPIFERARMAAERRGSPSEVARAISNIMMALMRLGRFEEILRLSPGIASTAEVRIDSTAFKIFCYVALSHAIMGNASEALELVPKCLHSASQTPIPWALQACQLHVSDVYTILSRHRDATRHARLATSGQSSTPLSRSYIGPFSRAVAKVAILDGCERDGLDRIECAESVFECDLIDRAEIACAKIQLWGQVGEVPMSTIAALKSSLEGLPVGILTTLNRLGLGKCLEYASRPPQDEVLLQHPL